MPHSWPEYFEFLEEKSLKWPQTPPVQPVSAQPSLPPIPEVKVVFWDTYGTLMRISDGELKRRVDDDLRMQIALEKTLEEFSMWQSMTRKPGAPWRYLMTQYEELLERLQMTKRCDIGDFPKIGLNEIWLKVLERLMKKDYTWDSTIHGDRERLAEHVGFFYHLSLQGVEVPPEVVETLVELHQLGVKQAFFGETEGFTLPHFLWLTQRKLGKSLPAGLLDPSLSVMSHTLGLRKSSQTFYKTAKDKLSEQQIQPHQVLVVSTRLEGDLELAKQHGWKTALLAFDKLSLQATPAELKQKKLKPDRLITSHRQVCELLNSSS